MYYTKLWIHLIWESPTTLPKAFMPIFYAYCREYAQQNGIILDIIGGTTNHVHALVLPNALQNIHKMVLGIKNDTQNWINRCHILEYFEWDDKYFALSVSESQVEQLRKYIQSQEILHQKKTWQEEKQEIMEKYGFLS